MRIQKNYLISSIISGVSFLAVASLSVYLIIYPAIAGRNCHIEDGCLNETGMIAIFGTYLIPFALVLLVLTIIFTVKAIKSRSH